MYLTKEQIVAFVERVGQPKASLLLNDFFNSYRRHLHASDLSPLYDANYLERLAQIEVVQMVADRFPIHRFSYFSYQHLAPRLRPHHRVLDIGCGAGDFTLALGSHGAAVVGVDLSQSAIQQAQAKLESATALNCRFICTSVENLPREAPIDFVVLNDVTEHLSDRELNGLFQALMGHLSPHAEILIHTPNGLALCNGTDHNWRQLLYKQYLRLCKGWQGQERSADQLFYDQLHINIKSYPQLKRFLSQFGLHSQVRYDEKDFPPGLTFLSSNMLVLARPR